MPIWKWAGLGIVLFCLLAAGAWGVTYSPGATVTDDTSKIAAPGDEDFTTPPQATLTMTRSNQPDRQILGNDFKNHESGNFTLTYNETAEKYLVTFQRNTYASGEVDEHHTEKRFYYGQNGTEAWIGNVVLTPDGELLDSSDPDYERAHDGHHMSAKESWELTTYRPIHHITGAEYGSGTEVTYKGQPAIRYESVSSTANQVTDINGWVIVDRDTRTLYAADITVTYAHDTSLLGKAIGPKTRVSVQYSSSFESTTVPEPPLFNESTQTDD